QHERHGAEAHREEYGEDEDLDRRLERHAVAKRCRTLQHGGGDAQQEQRAEGTEKDDRIDLGAQAPASRAASRSCRRPSHSALTSQSAASGIAANEMCAAPKPTARSSVYDHAPS